MTARSLAIALTLLLVFVQYKLWFAADGIAQTIDLNHSIASEMKTDQQFEKINEQLSQQITLLKSNKQGVSDLARQQLGMIKPGETYYQFVQ